MQEKPFCDFRRRVVSADRVFMWARGRAYLWSDMAKHSQGNITEAPFEIDSANWRLIEEAHGASLPPDVRADIVRATEVFFFSENFARTGEPTANVKVILKPTIKLPRDSSMSSSAAPRPFPTRGSMHTI